MSRVNEGIERGIDIYAENGDLRIAILQGTLAPDGVSGDQGTAPIGSLYARSGTGELYQKLTNLGAAGDWVAFGTGGAIGNWRPERVDAHTGQVLAAGVTDPTGWSDNDGGFDGTLATVGHYVLDGNCDLFEIVTVSSATSITLAAASDPPVAQDMFAVRYNLPDPAGQENQAIITFDGSACVKVADVDFANAAGITYTGSAAAGDPMNGDSVETVLDKLDGNNDAQDSVLGTSQGDTDLGTFTGTIIPDNTSVKVALQSLETQVDTNTTNIATNASDIAENTSDIADLRTTTGTADGDTDMGAYNGDVLTDGQSTKTNIQELSDAIEAGRRSFAGTVAASTPTVIDSLNVDDFQIATWTIVVRDTNNPDRVRRQEINSIHNGHGAADATQARESVAERVNIGNVNLSVNTVLSGAGASQTFGLEITTNEAGGISYTLERTSFLPLAG